MSKTGERGESVLLDALEVQFLEPFYRPFRAGPGDAKLVDMTYPDYFWHFTSVCMELKSQRVDSIYPLWLRKLATAEHRSTAPKGGAVFKKFSEWGVGETPAAQQGTKR